MMKAEATLQELRTAAYGAYAGHESDLATNVVYREGYYRDEARSEQKAAKEQQAKVKSTPECYALVLQDDHYKLKCHALHLLKGQTTIELMPTGGTGKGLKLMRQYGADQAKRFGVPFYDNTVEA